MGLPQNRFNDWNQTSRYLYKNSGGTWDSGKGPALVDAIQRYDSGYTLSPQQSQLLQETGFKFDKGSGGGGPGGGTTGSASRTAPTGFDLNPKPTGGNGPYGLVPGPLGLPDPYGDLSKVLPDLAALNSRTSASILDQLGGNLSPETQAALNNLAAERGVAGGMPGAQTWDHLFLGNIAGGMENLKQQGIQNYNTFIPNVSRTQTVDPNLQADIANQNAINAAAPDPAAAASEAERLYNKYRQSIGAPSGGGVNPGGGTRSGGFAGLPTMPSFNPTGGTGTNQPAPTTPGWGSAWNNQGGSATVGNVPQSGLPPIGYGGSEQGPPAPNQGTVYAPYGSDLWDEYNQWQF